MSQSQYESWAKDQKLKEETARRKRTEVKHLPFPISRVSKAEQEFDGNSLKVIGGSLLYTDEAGKTTSVPIPHLSPSIFDVFGPTLGLAINQSGLLNHLPDNFQDFKDEMNSLAVAIEDVMLKELRPFLSDSAFEKIDERMRKIQKSRSL